MSGSAWTHIFYLVPVMALLSGTGCSKASTASSTSEMLTVASMPQTMGRVEGATTLPPEHPFATCSTCHGPDGDGNRELQAPRLVGQDATYLNFQVTAFRQGWRGSVPEDVAGQQMRAIVATYPPEVFERAIEWIAAQSTDRRPLRLIGDRARGEILYRQSCAVCHGERGEGYDTYHMARLSHQHGWYLAAQLRAYRNGWRGINEADEEGRSMRFYAELLPDDQAVDDVAAWLVRASRD